MASRRFWFMMVAMTRENYGKIRNSSIVCGLPLWLLHKMRRDLFHSPFTFRQTRFNRRSCFEFVVKSLKALQRFIPLVSVILLQMELQLSLESTVEHNHIGRVRSCGKSNKFVSLTVYCQHIFFAEPATIFGNKNPGSNMCISGCANTCKWGTSLKQTLGKRVAGTPGNTLWRSLNTLRLNTLQIHLK